MLYFEVLFRVLFPLSEHWKLLIVDTRCVLLLTIKEQYTMFILSQRSRLVGWLIGWSLTG